VNNQCKAQQRPTCKSSRRMVKEEKWKKKEGMENEDSNFDALTMKAM
jgi:hypothetical protein